jgi:hypothetical protein
MSFKKILAIFVVWQVAIILVTGVSGSYLPRREILLGGLEKHGPFDPDPVGRNPYLYARGNFDGIHYIDIARKGSRGVGQTAFFPFYPELIHFFTPIFKDSTVAAVFISIVSFVIGLYFFAKLISLDYRSDVVFWTLVALLIFPTSFFFSAVYTEGLFFLLVVTSFYAARKQSWLLAVVLGAFAAYTRLVGIFLLPALVAELVQHYRGKKDSLRRILSLLPLLSLISVGLLAFMYYLYKTTGDALAFYHVQSIFGQGRDEKIVLIYQVFWRYIKMIFTVNKSDPLYLAILLEMASALIFSATTIYSLLKQRASYAIFNLLSFILPSLTGTFTSLPRYVLICFPSFIIIGQLIAHTSLSRRMVFLIVSVFLFVVYVSLFMRGYWVA